MEEFVLIMRSFLCKMCALCTCLTCNRFSINYYYYQYELINSNNFQHKSDILNSVEDVEFQVVPKKTLLCADLT